MECELPQGSANRRKNAPRFEPRGLPCGIRSGMGLTGSHTIKELQENGRFVKISNASLRENHPHDIQITKEAPNYSVNEK